MLTLGKTYRIKRGSQILCLAITVRGEWRLCTWKRGRMKSYPPTTAVAVAKEPDFHNLCWLWKTDPSVIDEFMERHVYAKSGDVAKVRSDPTRKVVTPFE